MNQAEISQLGRISGSVKFVVHGIAQPAGSKRAFVIPGKEGTRPSARVVDANAKSGPWKAEVRAAAAAAMCGRELFNGALSLDVIFYRPRPKGHFLKSGLYSSAGRATPYPTSKPDRTKLLRGLEDALTGICWRDDSQVVAGETRKQWGEPARVEVCIRKV